MRIGIAGDTHGRIETLKKAWKTQKFEFFIHTGDFYSDARRLAHYLNCEFYGVAGNCDIQKTDAPEELLLEAGDKKIYVVHGHQYGVKHGYQRLFYRGQELEADIVVCGHTHTHFCEQVEKIWMLNPGSASRPRKARSASCICLDIVDGMINPQICMLDL